MRIKIISIIILFIFLLVSFAVFNLQVIESKKYQELSDKNSIRLIAQGGSRGRILERGGNLIVGSYISYDVMVLPQQENETNKALSAVSSVTAVPLVELKARLKRGYITQFFPVTVVKNISLKKAIALGELKSDYSGIIIQPRALRYYPFGKLACHLLGYLNEIDHWRLTKLEDYGYKTKDIVGFGGVEEKYDYYLRGSEGALSIEVDHRGRFMRVLGTRPAKNGKDIQLCLDLKLQKIAEDVLGEMKGSVILMDPYTGAVAAMASSPGFNPSLFINSDNTGIGGIADTALINRAVSSAYAPGSVFKLVSAYAALETGKINLSTTFYCPGSMRIGNRQFNCWDTHHEENLAQAITHSCDVFFYKTGLLLGGQTIHDYALKFGFSKLTGIDLPYEASGFVPEPLWKRIAKFQNWYDGDTVNFAIGQGDLQVTPIQLARLMAVFANGGSLVTPYIVEDIAGINVALVKKKINIGIKPDVINYVRQDLRKVVSDPSGTASILGGLPIAVAGKTGTAQAGRGKTHGWFAGFFPFENPKFVICVFIENSGSGHSASSFAKLIIEEMVKEKLI